MPTTILLPALVIRLNAKRFLFAEARGCNAIRRYSRRNQRLLRGLRTAVPERHVVFRGPALVTVSLNQNFPSRMLGDELRIGLQRRAVLWTNFIAVVIEVCVLYVLLKQLLIAQRRLLRRCLRHRLRTCDGRARGRFLGSTRTAGGEPIRGRISRRHGL